ncbi:MAG: hypothetical protein HKN17_02500, partial [Rhodothermales bacterium]|nr:hypothetical protein [Rhodothermales bacterium]
MRGQVEADETLDGAGDTESPELSAYERAAQDENVDPRCIPQSLDEAPPVGDEIPVPDYPDRDHA